MGIMLFTSGTTAMSKAVMLSHTNLTTNIYDITSMFDIRKGDTLLSFLPLHHVFECTVGFLFAISVGAKLVFCEGIRHIADNLKDYQIKSFTKFLNNNYLLTTYYHHIQFIIFYLKSQNSMTKPYYFFFSFLFSASFLVTLSVKFVKFVCFNYIEFS